MDISIKYNLHQEVWVMRDNKPTKIALRSLKITSMYEGYSGEKWGDDACGKGGWPIRVFYCGTDIQNTPKESDWIPEYRLFETKEALLESFINSN